jgi:pimeloyl-ACP methyl ester carboxylesterase
LREAVVVAVLSQAGRSTSALFASLRLKSYFSGARPGLRHTQMEGLMWRRRCVALAFGLVAIGLTATEANAATVARQQATPRASRYGQVYLMRGLLGTVLTNGVDELAVKLRQRGVDAPVYSYGDYDTLADQAIAKYRAGNHGPIIIIGHSLGAISAIDMAKKLQQNRIPVSLIVTFGPIGDLSVPANVTSVVNYYQSKSYSNGRILRGPGFHGSLANIDLEKSKEINHLNMVNAASLHAQTVSRVLSLIGGHKPVAATPAATSDGDTPATTARSVAHSKD